MQHLPVIERPVLTPELEADIQLLLAFPLPRNRLMKLADGSHSENRSALLGAYSRQGAGVTRHTTQRRYIDAQWACHRIARLRSATALPYSSISINEGAFPRHTDSNRGPSVVFAFGAYSRGGLRLYDGDHSCTLEGQNCFILFDGAKEHEVCRYSGFRRSVTFFITYLPDRLEQHHWKALERWGYPTQECFKFLSLIHVLPDIVQCTTDLNKACVPEPLASLERVRHEPEDLPKPSAEDLDESVAQTGRASSVTDSGAEEESKEGAALELLEGLPVAEFPSQSGEKQHATVDEQDDLTFAGEFEDLLLPLFERGLRATRSPFREFLRAGHERLQEFLPECAEGAHTVWLPAPLDLLPCGLPYKENPIWLGERLNLGGLSSRRRLRRRRVLRRQAWINLIIASLSWLSLGKPSSGDKAHVLCMLLNGVQEHALRRLEGWVRQQCPAGKLWNFSALRRCRGLEGVFEFLGEDFYSGGGVSPPGDNVELASKVTEAMWISSKTASLPVQSAVVDLRLVLPPELFGLLSVPGMLSREFTAMEKEVLSLPPLFMRVQDWSQFSVRLVETGLCAIGDDTDAPTLGARHLRSGIFGVAKPDTRELRMIIDRRRKNKTEVSMRSALYERACHGLREERLTELRRHMTLPHSMQFVDLLLPDDCEFDMCLLDCKNFFYLLRVPEAAMKSTPIGWPVERSLFRNKDLPADVILCDLQQDTTATLYLRSPAMGDLKSVEVAQAAHTTVLLKAGMGRHEWLTLNSPCPTHGSWRGCYVDDYFHGVVVPGIHHRLCEFRTPMLAHSAEKLALTRAAYAADGFVEKEEKSKTHKTHAVVWGGEINSQERWLAGSRAKMEKLLCATLKLLRGRSRLVSTKALERIIGQWVHQLLFQRIAMSLLDDLYRVLHKRRPRRAKVLLTRGAIDELTLLTILWPLFATDLSRPISRVVTATDATLTRGGCVVGDLEVHEAVWIWQRLPRRAGSISWSQETNELGLLEAGRPDESLECFINSHPLRVVLNFKFRYHQHINVQEAVAARAMVKWLLRDPQHHSTRLPILVDNLVLQSVLTRGRTCSRILNGCMRNLAAFLMFGNVQLLSAWVRSAANPADDPTRGAPLRSPEIRSGELEHALGLVSTELPYAYEATLEMWYSRGWSSVGSTRLFDSTRGFPGEGPRLTWPNQRPDHRDSDLRVRVQPETARRYAQRLLALENWCLDQGFGNMQEVLNLSGPQISKLLCAYVQFLYASGSTLQQGLDTLAAVQMARPEISLDLRAAWQLQRQWAKLVPVGTRPPMPLQLMLGMAVTAWTLGLRRVAAVLILMFHCLLRPSEAGGCQRNQLLLPNDIVLGSVEAAIALPQTKTSDRGARLQAVAIEDGTVIDLLVRVFGNDPPHRSLIAGGTKGLQMLFNRVRTAMGLQDTPWTLATLRGGGAVAYLRQSGGNIVWLQFRGRWESFRSMRHYVQAGLAMQAFASLPEGTKALVGQLAALRRWLLSC
eukprot:5127379-Amphidinium_carterae.2